MSQVKYQGYEKRGCIAFVEVLGALSISPCMRHLIHVLRITCAFVSHTILCTVYVHTNVYVISGDEPTQ